MTEDKNWKILQIIPAQAGWKAVHCEGSASAERKISNRAIVCWALVEAVGGSAVGQREVRGIEQNANDLTVVDDVVDIDEVGEDDTDRNHHSARTVGPQGRRSRRGTQCPGDPCHPQRAGRVGKSPVHAGDAEILWAATHSA